MATISRGSKAAAAGKRLNIGGRCDHRNHVDFSYPSESILMRCKPCAAEVDHAPPAVRLWAESRFGHAMGRSGGKRVAMGVCCVRNARAGER